MVHVPFRKLKFSRPLIAIFVTDLAKPFIQYLNKQMIKFAKAQNCVIPKINF